MADRAYGRWLASIVALYVMLGLAFVLATPPFESSDEYKHFPVVQHLQATGTWPVLDAEAPGRWQQEAGQPPLYYGLMAGLTSWIDTSDLPDVYQVNPHAYVGDPNQIKNKNLMIHDRAREAFPWSGSILALYVIRLASLALGVGTVVFAARLGELLFARRVGLLAAALTAFNPMFLFVSSAVNNDSLAALLGAMGIWVLARLWRDPAATWRYPVLGLVLGAGLLTKLSLGGLLAISLAALAWLGWRRRDGGWLVLRAALVGAPALLLVAPWLWRNWQLYGDLTALNAFVAVQGSRAEPLTLAGWAGEFGTLYRSFWGLFGGVNVAAPQWFYLVCNALFVAGVGGLLLDARRRGFDAWRRGAWLPAAWLFVLGLLLLRWNLIAPSFQGRLLFPGLTAWNALWAAGLIALDSRRRVAILAPAFLLVMAALLPWTSIRPAYAFPSPLETVPEAASFGPLLYETPAGTLRLVGVAVPDGQTIQPGGAAPAEVTLFWQAVTPVRRDLVTAVHLLGRGLVSIGQIDRYPAWGMIPTSRWEPGQIWEDPYHIYATAGATAPAALRLHVALYDAASGEAFTPLAPNGTSIALPRVGPPIRLAGDDGRAPDQALNVAFADGIRLRGYSQELDETGGSLIVTLFWAADGTPSQDYTVFVQLRDDAGSPLAFGDAPPLSGDYPTSLWRAGDRITDPHTVTLPPVAGGRGVALAVGFYDPSSGARLGRLDGRGDEVIWAVEASHD